MNAVTCCVVFHHVGTLLKSVHQSMYPFIDKVVHGIYRFFCMHTVFLTHTDRVPFILNSAFINGDSISIK